jgi:hypothetical protein
MVDKDRDELENDKRRKKEIVKECEKEIEIQSE